MQTQTAQGATSSVVARLMGKSIVTRVLLLASVSLVVLTATTLIVAQNTTASSLTTEVSQADANIVKVVEQRVLDHGAPSIIDGKLYFGTWAVESEPTFLDSVNREILVSVGRVAALVLALAILLLWLALRPIGRGLRQLTTVANALAEGDVQQEPSIHSKDELGVLAEAFRRMIAYQHAAPAAGGLRIKPARSATASLRRVA